MGLLDFFRKRRDREKENGKRGAALIQEVRGWVYEDLENRADLVCIAAVTGSLAQYGVERAEKQWRFMMAEDNSSGQSSEEAEAHGV